MELGGFRGVWFNRGPHHPPIPDVPALAVIVVYCLLLFNLPSRLIIRQIGAPGTPANLWALTVLMWWVCFRVAGRIPVRHRNPVRAALVCSYLPSW